MILGMYFLIRAFIILLASPFGYLIVCKVRIISISSSIVKVRARFTITISFLITAAYLFWISILNPIITSSSA